MDSSDVDGWDCSVEYDRLCGLYSLPDFVSLERDFDVEKVVDKETSFLLREVRRCISDKLSSCMSFFESLVNPSLTPLFVMSSLKQFSRSQMVKVRDIYRVLSRLSLRVSGLESWYDESSEASFIMEVSELWQTLGKDIRDVCLLLEEKSDVDISIDLNAERNYFN